MSNGALYADLFADNTGAYELAKAPKMPPRTKHIALKYHHFREHGWIILFWYLTTLCSITSSMMVTASSFWDLLP